MMISTFPAPCSSDPHPCFRVFSAWKLLLSVVPLGSVTFPKVSSDHIHHVLVDMAFSAPWWTFHALYPKPHTAFHCWEHGNYRWKGVLPNNTPIFRNAVCRLGWGCHINTTLIKRWVRKLGICGFLSFMAVSRIVKKTDVAQVVFLLKGTTRRVLLPSVIHALLQQEHLFTLLFSRLSAGLSEAPEWHFCFIIKVLPGTITAVTSWLCRLSSNSVSSVITHCTDKGPCRREKNCSQASWSHQQRAKSALEGTQFQKNVLRHFHQDKSVRSLTPWAGLGLRSAALHSPAPLQVHLNAIQLPPPKANYHHCWHLRASISAVSACCSFWSRSYVLFVIGRS